MEREEESEARELCVVVTLKVYVHHVCVVNVRGRGLGSTHPRHVFVSGVTCAGIIISSTSSPT